MQSAPLILIVDDDADTRELYTFCLRLGGLDTVAVADGTQALLEAQRRKPNAVLTDLRLPGFDGVELVRRLRSQNIGAPVLLLTGWTSTSVEAGAKSAGARGVVLKPCLPDVLLARVMELLQETVGTPSTT